MSIKERVLNFLREIPKGKVSTYKIIADKFSTHPRAIAMYMKHNKDPETFPCYKIISHSGKIGGYSGENGVTGKIARLKNDGIEIVNGVISKKYFYDGTAQ